MNNSNLESFGLKLSVAGTLFMSALGIYFGLFIQSEAILLDGFFNLISLIMAIATLWVSWLTKKPANQHFQFDYLNFIPTVNLVKGLLIFIVSIFALLSGIIAILEGGRNLQAGLAVIYAIIAAIGCLFIGLTQNKIAHKTGSVMVMVDAKNWVINGLISLSVGVAFALVAFMKNTAFDWFTAYADSTIVIILVLVTLPVPIKIILQSAKQLLLGAPSSQIQQNITTAFTSIIETFYCEQYRLRMSQTAQYVYLHLIWLFPPEVDITVAETDKIRNDLTRQLKASYEFLILDIIFTQDTAWFAKVNSSFSVREG